MTGSFEVQKEHTRWATEVLDIDSSRSTTELTELALARLGTDDFVLWQQADLAVRVLAGTDQSVWTPRDLATLRQLSEAALWDEVEQFCDSFFDLPTAQRQERYKSIVSRCAGFPAIAIRMKQLASGLDLTPWNEQQPFEESEAEKNSRVKLDDELKEGLTLFGNDVVRFFLTSPSERGSFERTLVKKWDKDPLWWSKVASQFDIQNPERARLAPKLVNRVRSLVPSHHWRTETDREIKYQSSFVEQRRDEKRRKLIHRFIFVFFPLIALVSGFLSAIYEDRMDSKDESTPNYSAFPFSVEQQQIQKQQEAEFSQALNFIQSGGEQPIEEYHDSVNGQLDDKTFEKFLPFQIRTSAGLSLHVSSMDQVNELVTSRPELMKRVLDGLENQEGKVRVLHHKPEHAEQFRPKVEQDKFELLQKFLEKRTTPNSSA